MWSPDLVKCRYLEAAETERYLPRPRMGTGAGFWPIHRYTQEDRDGWDKTAQADNADAWARDRKLTREAISRHDECLSWSIMLLRNEQHRHIVWRWAFCQANGWSFSETCKRRGWVRVTAYRRLTASFDLISEHLLGSGTLPRLPEERFMLQDEPKSTIHCGTAERSDDAHQPIKYKRGYRTEPSRDLIQTQDDADTFAKFLERRNARMRKINGWRNEAVAEAG